DGGEAEGTVHFGLDGAEYEIDLSAAHSKALRKTAEKYIAAGRKVGGGPRRGGPRGGRKKSSGGPGPARERGGGEAGRSAGGQRGARPRSGAKRAGPQVSGGERA